MTQPAEKWKSVVGYDGYYEVSDQGRVRSLDRVVRAKGNGVRPLKGALLTIDRAREDGRGQVRLSMDGSSRPLLVYRLVLAAFVGPCPPGMEGCHNDGDASNDRLENLRWDTRSANILDAVRHRTHDRTRRTHCPNDHPLQLPNLVAGGWKRGRRQCLACNRAFSYANFSRRRHGVVLDHKALADDYYERITQKPVELIRG